MTKNKVYTWNEDLQRVIEGTLPQDIEARQHDILESVIDDKSEFLPRGKRRSERRIAERIAKDKADVDANNARLDKRKHDRSQTGREDFGTKPSDECNIPHNQNRVSDSEYGENYKWQIALAILIFFFVGLSVIAN